MKSALLNLMMFVGLSFSLTSCFDIVDEITVNKDGSGEITITANLSKSKTKIASIMLMDSINGHKVPQKADIEKILNDAVTYLEKTAGISNISKKTDFDNYIFSISCSFTSVENIDNIISEITKDQKVKPVMVSYAFDGAKKMFSKNYIYTPEAKKQYDKLKAEDKKVFDEASYTSIFRFENEVASVSNNLSKISPSRKAVMLKTAALELINGNVSLSNTIQLK